MNLDELKAKATAGELALIEKTEALVADEKKTEVRRKALVFLRGNPPDTDMGGRRISELWLDRFAAAISAE